ncbi:hypothetical protein [Sorangium sp. So ce1078]|uniref:hypothetical protein n=1 Tax=Sorangium sp. So ce1078 TaxID=3133329 RepID=UPI003F62263B
MEVPYYGQRGDAAAATSSRAPWYKRNAPFAQRFHVMIASDGRPMEGEGMMKKDGGEWEPDLRLSYARAAT